MKDLISLHDLTSEEVKGLLELGLKLKREQKSGIEHHILKGKTWYDIHKIINKNKSII